MKRRRPQGADPRKLPDMSRISYGGEHLLWRTLGLARADEVIE
jgi:hypothetical protein